MVSWQDIAGFKKALVAFCVTDVHNIYVHIFGEKRYVTTYYSILRFKINNAQFLSFGIRNNVQTEKMLNCVFDLFVVHKRAPKECKR